MRAIDADALIHELNNSHYPGAPYVDAGISIAIGKVCDAPTIELERKTGKWIPMFNGAFKGGAYWFECSECKRIVPEVRNGGWGYCPNCGADMRGEGGQE